MDTYGKSMIAICVNDDGSLNTCTCRWNHDNGANDNMMDTKQISEFFGVDFYKTFKPYDANDLWKKMLEKQVPHDEIEGLSEDTFCKTFDCILISCDDYDENYEYKKLIDGKIVTLPFVDSTTTFIDGNFMTMKDGKFVSAVPEEICSMPEDIKGKFVIPDGVTSIGSSAFYDCSSLTSVTIPSSVTNIGVSAFKGCSRLTSVTIPDSVTSIGDNAFANCEGLINVMIPNSVTSIRYGTFSGCSGLVNITIPNNVTSIGMQAFAGCQRLKSLMFKDKTLEEVQSMKDYPWGIEDESVIKAEASLNESKHDPAICYWAHMLDDAFCK